MTSKNFVNTFFVIANDGSPPVAPDTSAFFLFSVPDPKTNPSVDHFQYHVILEAIHAPDEYWGQDYLFSRSDITKFSTVFSINDYF